MKTVDVLDLPDDARALIAESEISGRQTLFERNGRPVAILVSYDEYLALRETIDIANDPELVGRIQEAGADETIDRISPKHERVRVAAQATLDDDAMGTATSEALARIDDDPIAGAPLFAPLKGLWSYRTGPVRIVYRIDAEARVIVVLGITKA